MIRAPSCVHSRWHNNNSSKFEMFSLCDTITVLCNGRHVRTVAAKATTEGETVRFMVGRELLAFHRNPVEGKGDIVLRVSNLSKKGQYEDVTFQLRRGEIVAMAGLIGAGRSEMALGIFGSPPPDRGDVYLRGSKSAQPSVLAQEC